MSKSSRPEPKPLAYTFTQFWRDVYPMSRAKAVLDVRNGELETFMDGGRRMVLVKKGREYVARKATKGGAVPPEVSAQKSAAGLKGRALQLEAMRDSAKPGRAA